MDSNYLTAGYYSFLALVVNMPGKIIFKIATPCQITGCVIIQPLAKPPLFTVSVV
jgi:hypothetical protein